MNFIYVHLIYHTTNVIYNMWWTKINDIKCKTFSYFSQFAYKVRLVIRLALY